MGLELFRRKVFEFGGKVGFVDDTLCVGRVFLMLPRVSFIDRLSPGLARDKKIHCVYDPFKKEGGRTLLLCPRCKKW